MSIIGKCPKCEKLITEIKAVSAPAKDGQRPLKGAVYVCPLCNTILGAGLDPLATVDEIVHRVRGG
jgi:hypothetical protein